MPKTKALLTGKQVHGAIMSWTNCRLGDLLAHKSLTVGAQGKLEAFFELESFLRGEEFAHLQPAPILVATLEDPEGK